MCTYTTARCRLPGLWDLQGLSAPAAELQLECGDNTRMGTPFRMASHALDPAARPHPQLSGSAALPTQRLSAALSTQRLRRALNPAAQPRPQVVCGPRWKDTGAEHREPGPKAAEALRACEDAALHGRRRDGGGEEKSTARLKGGQGEHTDGHANSYTERT